MARAIRMIPSSWRNFLNKGGKVILYHGGSDPLVSPFESIWFYEELASLHGGYRHTQDSVRLFIVPGMGHCGGGVAPNSFDTLQAARQLGDKRRRPGGDRRDGTERPDDAALQVPGGGKLFGVGRCQPRRQLELQSQR